MSGARKSVACVAVVCLSGCAALSGITQKPEITLSDIEVQDIGLLEQRFGLKLRVHNPNDAEIPINGLTYEVEVNGQRFAKGVSDKHVTVPRYGEAMLEVSAVSNLRGLLRHLSELRKNGSRLIEYRLRGRLNTGYFSGVPFDHKGEVALPQLPGMAPPRGGKEEPI